MNIKYYEAMCKFTLSDEERQNISRLAGETLSALSVLDGIDTQGVEPLVSVLDIKNVMREDIAEKLLPREEILANAPEQYDGYFQVPRTLD